MSIYHNYSSIASSFTLHANSYPGFELLNQLHSIERASKINKKIHWSNWRQYHLHFIKSFQRRFGMTKTYKSHMSTEHWSHCTVAGLYTIKTVYRLKMKPAPEIYITKCFTYMTTASAYKSSYFLLQAHSLMKSIKNDACLQDGLHGNHFGTRTYPVRFHMFNI